MSCEATFGETPAWSNHRGAPRRRRTQDLRLLPRALRPRRPDRRSPPATPPVTTRSRPNATPARRSCRRPSSSSCRADRTTSSPGPLAYRPNRSRAGARTSPGSPRLRRVAGHGVMRGAGVSGEPPGTPQSSPASHRRGDEAGGRPASETWRGHRADRKTVGRLTESTEHNLDA
jgi:hypothetical protein